MVVPATVNAVSDPTFVSDDVTTVLFNVVPLNVDALATLAVKAYDADVANDDVNGVNVMDVAADAVVANDDVNGVNVIDVAADDVSANDAEVILPLKLPVLICRELLTIPTGNMVGANDAEVANDDVNGVNVIDVAADDVSANDDVNGVNVIDVAADAVVANDDVNGVNVIDVAADAVVANDALTAVLASPINDPVKDPVLICKELLTIPDGSIVGANDAEVILPLKLPVLICTELLTVPAGITLNPVNDTDLLTSASKFTIIDDDTVLSNICKPDIFAVVIGMLE